MSQSPFSDTTSPNPPAPDATRDALALTERLGMPPMRASSFGRWETVLFAALHKMIDRMEAAEKRLADAEAARG